MPYAFTKKEHHWIENYCSEDQRLRLFEYLRDNPVEKGSYKVLTMEEIEKVFVGLPPLNSEIFYDLLWFKT
jgi:hypothetical protein